MKTHNIDMGSPDAVRNLIRVHSPSQIQVHERQDSRLAQVGRFLRHLAEMILAMMVGMGIWALIAGLFLRPIGYSDLARTYPELRFGLLAIFMSAPMVLLMRYRGHSWERGVEMVLAMATPMAAVVLCWRIGMDAYTPVLSYQALPISTHVGMYLGMLLLMLYRHKEYTHAHPTSHAMGGTPRGNSLA